MALLYDSRFQGFLGNLKMIWLGPYEIIYVYDNGTIHLTTIDDCGISFLSNGHRIFLYHTPITWESFLYEIHNDANLQVVAK